jgi:hypothetical protein
MDTNQAQQNIKIIREMVEKTRINTASTWPFFILWGSAIILAIIGMYGLVYMKLHKYIWVNWVAICGIASVISTVLGIRHSRRERVKTYAQQAINALVLGTTVMFVLTGYLFPILGIYPVHVIPIIAAAICGVLTISMSGILDWGFLKWCGFLWMAGAAAMAFITPEYRTLLLIPLLAVGYIWPGFRLYKNDKQNRQQIEG